MEILNVQIHGHSFKIKTDATAEYVNKVVAYINRKIDDISETNTNMEFSRLVILAILEIADELFQLRQIAGEGDGDLSRKTRELINNIDAKLSILKNIVDEDNDTTEQ